MLNMPLLDRNAADSKSASAREAGGASKGFDKVEGVVAVRLTSVTYGGEGINVYELKPLVGTRLWPFTAGAHIDLYLPNGLMRQYSLINSASDQERYLLGIKRDRTSRGASSFIHDQLRVGEILKIGRPRNNFPLVEDARHSVFLAGGIGVTPIIALLQRAEALGLSWELHYSVRRRSEAAFLDLLHAFAPRCHLHIDDECGGAPLDIGNVLAEVSPSAHLYCCGPAAMLDAFQARTSSWPKDQVHLERFTAEPGMLAGGFVVKLARSGKTVPVPPGQSILTALRAAGIEVDSSCELGVCGVCETKVLSGTPDHKDLLLSPEEHAANGSMMICCSGSQSDVLVLDL